MYRLWLLALPLLLFTPGNASGCPYGETSIKVLVAFGAGEVRTNKGADACNGEGNAIWRAEQLFAQSKKDMEAACTKSGGHADWTEGPRHQPDFDRCTYHFGGTTAWFRHEISEVGDCCRPKESVAPLAFPPLDLKSNASCNFYIGAEWQTVFADFNRSDAKKTTCPLAMEATSNALSKATEAAEKRCTLDPVTGKPNANVKFLVLDEYTFAKCSPPESSFGGFWSHTRGADFLCCRKSSMDAAITPPQNASPPPLSVDGPKL